MTAMQDDGAVPELSLGLRLEIARRRVGYSQVDMAEQLGMDRGTISDFERDIRPPKRGTIIAWSRLTGVSLSWLETGEAADPDDGGGTLTRLPRLDSNQQPAAYQNMQVRALQAAA